ncbi:MAG: hypothetical protein WC489_00460 [Patescibacteria group bacterium]
MKQKISKTDNKIEDPLLLEVVNYLNRFDFPLAFLIQKKFKIGFSRAEKILKQIEAKKIDIKHKH